MSVTLSPWTALFAAAMALVHTAFTSFAPSPFNPFTALKMFFIPSATSFLMATLVPAHLPVSQWRISQGHRLVRYLSTARRPYVCVKGYVSAADSRASSTGKLAPVQKHRGEQGQVKLSQSNSSQVK